MKYLAPQSNPSYGFHATAFGECCIAFSSEGICALIFHENQEEAIADINRRFQKTNFNQDNKKAAELIQQIFEKSEKPVLNLIGTDFQISVWRALQQIPKSETTTYAKIAKLIGRPKAVRAVGSAIGANPISFLIPCHRVIRTDGKIGGYRWGLERKKSMLENENIKL